MCSMWMCAHKLCSMYVCSMRVQHGSRKRPVFPLLQNIQRAQVYHPGHPPKGDGANSWSPEALPWREFPGDACPGGKVSHFVTQPVSRVSRASLQYVPNCTATATATATAPLVSMPRRSCLACSIPFHSVPCPLHSHTKVAQHPVNGSQYSPEEVGGQDRWAKGVSTGD